MDWKWQLKNSIKDVTQLEQCVNLSEIEKKNIDKTISTYKMSITPYFSKLLGCEAIYKQVIPNINELSSNNLFTCDPLIERKNSPVPRLVHKFTDRVAILVSDLCFSYCRYCTRKNTVLKNVSVITDDEITQIVSYLKETPSVTDVLITGGDPFILDDDILEKILSQLRSVPSVSTIRIGTRSVVFAPMRITNELVKMLSKYHPLWINIQINHPVEITDSVVKACDKLLAGGIPLNNQSVLLRGVNDNIEVIKELLLSLIKLRIRPYYLYQCDYVQGTQHFMTDYNKGMDIISSLWGNVPGYAIPRFIMDTESGKINIEHNNILRCSSDELILKGYNGKEVCVRL